MPRTRGFTLIELMIAVSLGMLVVFTAISGFRVASQTITTSKRLSLENSLLRSGYFEAQHQLDFWTNLDDPAQPDAERPLKRTGGADSSIGDINHENNNMKRGLPFTPMRDLHSGGVWPRSAGVPRFDDSRTINGARVNTIMPRDLATFAPASSANSDDSIEKDTGFDPSYSWSPHDPRTWVRVDLAGKERDGVTMQYVRDKDKDGHDTVPNPLYPDKWDRPDFPEHFPLIQHGRYILFSNPENTGVDLPSFKIVPDPNKSIDLYPEAVVDPNNKMIEITYSGYTHGGTHTWYPHQVSRLINAMGYAALCEYLPPNSFYSWYSLDEDRGQRSEGSWFNRYGTHDYFGFCNDNGSQRSARGIWRNTYPYSYGYLNPRAPNDWRDGGNLRQRFYQRYKADTDAVKGQNASDLAWFVSRTGFQEGLMEERPQVWPEVKVSVGRFIKSAHHVAVAKITRFSPLTGEVIELSWTGLGTTLRGARQQRQPTTGWARWDNDPGTTNDPTLDSP